MTITREHLIDLIEASKLERWEGLRTIPSTTDGLVKLPNDDTLAAQLKGMTFWLEQNEDYIYVIGIKENGDFVANPENIALSYVVRQMVVDQFNQLTSQNVLLNMQDTSTRATEAARLDFWVEQLKAPQDLNLQSTMRLMSRVLKEDKGSDLTVFKQHLAAACAFFYLQTGLEAAENFSKVTSLIGDLDSLDVRSQEIAESYQLLAVNAYVNNIGVFEAIKDQLPENHPIRAIVTKLSDVAWIKDDQIKEKLFNRSLAKVIAQPTSSTAPVTAAQAAVAVLDHGRAP
ncbi:MAG: hypothetical protein JNK24_06255 [Alphaproteobacteria bacterium]|nr:hypothetical protein [Alphaproteobacteria bacterium]